MNAQTQVQVPTVKLAKVGQKRKKRNFIPFLPEFLGGGSSPWGAAGGLSMGAKLAIVFLISTLGVGAYQAGRSMKLSAANQGGVLRSIFAAKPNLGNGSGLPTEQKNFRNSLGLADAVKSLFGWGNNNAGSGTGQDQTAGNAAQGAEAGAAGAGAAAGASPFDALAKAKAAADAAKDKSGQQGDGLDSGLASGADGGSGGGSSAGSSLAGGSSGLSGLAQSGGVVNTAAGPAGKVSPLGLSGTGANLAAGLHSGVQGLGALPQLRGMSNMNQYEKAGNAQMASAASGQGFDTGQSAGSAITGAGINGGTGNAAAPPSSEDNPSGGNDGGPTNGGYGGGYGNPSPPTTPVSTPAPGATSSAPWAGLVNNAGIFLTIAMVLLFVAAFIGATPWGKTIAMWVAGIAALLAGFSTLLGMMMMGMGQMQTGILITALGGITTAAAAIVAINSHAAAQAQAKGALLKETFWKALESEFTGQGITLLGAGPMTLT